MKRRRGLEVNNADTFNQLPAQYWLKSTWGPVKDIASATTPIKKVFLFLSDAAISINFLLKQETVSYAQFKIMFGIQTNPKQLSLI